MLKNYLRMAWRTIMRQKAYSLINILGLSLGLTACIVLFLLVHYELSFDRFLPDRKLVYQLVVENDTRDGIRQVSAAVPAITPSVIRREVPGVQCITGYHWYKASIRVATPSGNGRQADRVVGNTVAGQDRPSTIIADSSWFSFFPYQWMAGHPASALSLPFQV